MTEIRFYQMQRKRLEQALPEIVAKALERGHRLVVKAGSRERVEALDSTLWTADPGSFLPHGYVKDGTEGDQPVWLTTEDENPNQATMLVLADGAPSATVGTFDLCCELFDGNDESSVTAARERWKVYQANGHTLSYFLQDESGKWQKKS